MLYAYFLRETGEPVLVERAESDMAEIAVTEGVVSPMMVDAYVISLCATTPNGAEVSPDNLGGAKFSYGGMMAMSRFL